jgi:hypothetical protein
MPNEVRPKNIHPYPLWHRWISLLIGVTFLISGLICAIKSIDYVYFAERAEATVVGFAEQRRSSRKFAFPIFQFELSSGEVIKVESRVSGFRKVFQLNQKFEIMYFKQHPEAARINSFDQTWLFPIFFTVFGLFWVQFGPFGSPCNILKTRSRKKLKTTGVRIMTELVRVERAFFALGRPSVSPFIIVTSWQDLEVGTLREFKSCHLWYDPTPYLHSKRVEVYVSSKNKMKYWMDTDFLPSPIEK